MKLVDILARELKAWPSGKEFASQDPDKEVRFCPGVIGDFYALTLADDSGKYFGGGERVTHTQWQAAVDALKAGDCEHSHGNDLGCPECGGEFSPKPWNGEGKPPVGIEIEMKYKAATAEWARPDFHPEILAWVGSETFVTIDEKFGSLSDVLFRPVRTPEQIAAESRKAAIKEMTAGYGHMALTGWAEYVYDTLGYRKPELQTSRKGGSNERPAD